MHDRAKGDASRGERGGDQSAGIADAARRELSRGARTLLRTPFFTLVALATLALGIGTTAAIYSLIDGVVLRPLPFPEPQQLVAVKHGVRLPGAGAGHWGLSVAGYHYLRREARSFIGMGASMTLEVTLLRDGAAETVPAAQVTASLVGVLGLQPAFGRAIQASDDTPDAEPVVMLSHEAWATRWGGDSSVVGRTISLGGEPVRVVGVMTAGTRLPQAALGSGGNGGRAMARVDLWLPFRLDPAAAPVNAHYLSGIGRLRDGTTPEAAEREVAALVARFPELFPGAYPAAFIRDYHFTAAVSPLQEEVVGAMGRTLWILLGAVFIVFVVATANVANLFLVRAEGRRQEHAIRRALGAGRRDVALQGLAESMPLALVAGVLGTWLAAGGLALLRSFAPADFPRLDEVHVRGGTMLVSAALAALAGLIFGILPLIRARAKTEALMETGYRMTASRSRQRLRAGLVAAQIALAVVLLAGAGVLVRTMQHLREVPLGFVAPGAVAVDVALPRARYATYRAVWQFQQRLSERLGGLPGVTAAGAATGLPLEGYGTCALVFGEGEARPADQQAPCIINPLAGPGYFEAMGITVRGRVPTWGDLGSGSGAVVITRALADRLWPGQDPIGRGLKGNGNRAPYYTVTGVIEALRVEGAASPPSEVVFFPLDSIPGAPLWFVPTAMTVVVRASGNATGDLARAVRRVVAELEPAAPVENARTLEAVVRESTARTTLLLGLLGVAAGMALLLSVVGLYGVVSYVVSQRRFEMGVRMALGARAWQIRRQVVGQTLRLGVVGVAVGVVASLQVNGVLASLLYETSPSDPATLAVVAILLLLIAMLASFLPARRASAVDPSAALRGG
jgi:putative ABC transport system permease protein